MSDLPKMSFFEMFGEFRRRTDEKSFLFPLMSTLPQSFDDLSKAQSCLSLGPGFGQYDLEFIERCLPNLKKFVAVEIDEYCSQELRRNIECKFGNKFETEIFNEDVRTWNRNISNNGDKNGKTCFDVILLCHMLYGFKPNEIFNILDNCLNVWLSPSNGIVIILENSEIVDGEGKTKNVIQNVHRYLNQYTELLTEADEIKEMLSELEAEVHFDKKYTCHIDYRDNGDDIIHIYNQYFDNKVDSSMIKKALQEVARDGIGESVCELMVVKKK